MDKINAYKQELQSYGDRLDFNYLFKDQKGKEKKSVAKQQSKLLIDMEPCLKHALAKDEKVLSITYGLSPFSLWEQIFTGWIILYLKGCVLVATNQRLLHILIGGRKRNYRHSIAEIPWGHISELKSSFKKLKLTYTDGTKENFVAHSKGFNFAALVENLFYKQGSLLKETVPAEKRRHLCPRCFDVLSRDTYNCRRCQLKFKNMEQAKRLSWLYPGGGYFYTGHPFMGIADILAEAYLIIALISVGVLYFNNPSPEFDKAGVGFMFIFFVLLLLIEKILTVYHSRHFIKEYIPEDKNIEVRKDWSKPKF